MAGILPDWLQNSGLFGNMSAPQQAQSAPEQGGGGFLSGLGNYLGDNSAMLLGLGGGIASGGIGKGLQLAGQYSLLDQAQRDKSQAAAVQRANILSTYQSLKAAGIPESQAQAAALNPKILETLAPQVFGHTPKFTTTGQTPSGTPQYGFVDESRGTVTPYQAPGAAQSSNATGDEFLKTLDNQTAGEVKAIAEGRAGITGRNLQRMLPLVTQYDPNFDQINYQSRQKTLQTYTSGKQMQELQALNTVAGHLDNLKNASDKLDNTQFPLVNTVKNFASSAMGGGDVDRFNTAKQAVTNELAKAYHGGHVSDTEVRAWQQNINDAKSPEQFRTVIGELGSLLQSKIQSSEEAYRLGMGPKAPLPKEFSAVSDHAKDVFGKVNEWASNIKQPAAAAAPVSPTVQAQPLAGGWQDLGGGVRIREKR